MCCTPGWADGNSASVWWMVLTRSSGASPIQSETRAFRSFVQNCSSRGALEVFRPMWLK
jgi:hypothetical protein